MKKILTLFGLASLLCSGTLADEGMWTFNGFPSDQVKEKYGFTPDTEWLEHVRLSSVRLAEGCSGSFVSPDGLVMTNHHCAHSCIEQLSTAARDYVAAGFYAKTLVEEVRCPEIEINQLTKITDVTARVAAVTKGLKEKEYNDALKAEMSKLEKECAEGTEIRCDVVSLYHGGKYDLYRYKRFQDVRLVFAPEFAIAFFGGDPDNFMFPRYDLDLAFLRVYENDQPVRLKHYFKWSGEGAKNGDLVFVSGHPGGSSRLLTVAELEFERDFFLVKRQLYQAELRGLLTEFQNRGAEQKRYSNGLLFGIENSLKARRGMHERLLDKRFFAMKVASEKAFRRNINSNPEWRKAYGGAWDAIAGAQGELKKIWAPLTYLENGRGFSSTLFHIARTLVRSAAELPKANEKRLREYADSNLPAVRQNLFSAAPIYDDLEIETLTFSLTKLREELGVDDPRVRKVLGTFSPRELAVSLIKGTKLRNVELRKSLFEGGQAAIEKSDDPMVVLARKIDTDARQIRTRYEDSIESVIKKNNELIARAQFAVYGASIYPDATFTLRLTYGQVKGYKDARSGKEIQPLTRIAGAFERNTGRDPFALPASWIKAKDRLDLNTPMNFCTTNDIIGGNSGSPVINRNAEIVGLVFDGNIESLGGEYGFDPAVNRAVAVHGSAIEEALRKIYHAERLVTELKPR